MTEPKVGFEVTVVLPPEVMETVALMAADIIQARTKATGRPESPWLYGAKAAAEYLGMPIGRIEKLQAAERIPSHRVGERRYAYHRDELDRWVAGTATR